MRGAHCYPSQSPWEDWQPQMRKRLRACAVCSAGPTSQLCRSSAHSVVFRRPQSCHVPIERKALIAAMTNPYSPLWVSVKVPSLGSGDFSPFSGHFLVVVPPPHQLLLSTRSLSPSHLCLPDSVPMGSTHFRASLARSSRGSPPEEPSSNRPLLLPPKLPRLPRPTLLGVEEPT